MPNATGCAVGAPATDPCPRCDVLLGLDGVQVVAVQRQDHRLRVTVQTPWQLTGCPDCGVVALSTGRRTRVLHDVPGIVPVEVLWRQRRWECPDPGCPRGTFSEQFPGLVAPRGSITTRAIRWAIGQLRAEHATIAGLARRLGVSWWTLWRVVKPHLQALAAEESRFAGVATLGVDEHVWHHTPHKTAVKGPGMFTGMVDLSRDADGRVHARLLDLVPGRTGKAYATWLTERTPSFRDGVKVATLDPFRGYANALRDELSEAVPVLDAFHVVKLAAQAMDEVRRRVQQDTLGHRGHAGDPLYRVRNILHRAAGDLTERQWARLADCLGRGDPDDEVLVAWQCYQRVRAAYAADKPADGKQVAEHIVASFPGCPIREIARLGRTLRQWKDTYLGYFTTGGANNGGTEAIHFQASLTAAALRDYREAHPLARVFSMLDDVLGQAARDCGAIMAVSDAAGQLLWVCGSPCMLRQAEKIGFIEGSNWDERMAGTNAPGMALALDESVQVIGAEHFRRSMHRWSCAATPIHDPTSQSLLGVLDITGGDNIVVPQTNALVRAAARLAESEPTRS